MATIICPQIDNVSTRGDQPNTNFPGIEYGMNMIGGVVQTLFRSYIQYDISGILKNRITRINLYGNRLQIRYTNYANYSISTFQMKSGYGLHDITYINYERVEVITHLFNGDDTIISGNHLLGYITDKIPNILADQKDGVLGLLFQVGSLTLNSGVAIENNTWLSVDVEYIPPLAPTNLLPASLQNPRGPITFSWWHNPNPELPIEDDPQTDWELQIWQSGVTPIVITQNNADNTYTLPANTFTQYETVYFKVRTKTQFNSWGAYTESSFELGATPPLAPTLTYPPSKPVNGKNGILLEWAYNSPYDTFPSRFDIRYNRDGGEWIYLRNDSYGDRPAYQSAMTSPITTQDKITWQVMAYGALGDAGPWSELGIFWTIGIPDAPTIVRATNSNRPTIYFSAENLMAWNIEIIHNENIVYKSTNQPFLGDFQHRVNQFLSNGNYLARMNIINEFGLTSEWVQFPFTISTVAPEPLELQIVSNPRYNIRLHFNNTGKTVYVYRSELRKDSWLRIAMTTGNIYDDFTVRPSNKHGIEVRYKYFVRVVNPNDSFADSNIVTGSLRFLETTIAEANKPNDMIKLLHAIGKMPDKSATFDSEKTLTRFIGRERPVLQIGEHTDKNLNLGFYCTIEDYERLEQIHMSEHVLILRDWRLGSIYGTINGSISPAREMDGFNVSFIFTQVDYNEEVELL